MMAEERATQAMDPFPVATAIAGRKRVIEIFSAGCHACDETIKLVRQIACRSCDVRILDMKDRHVTTLAKALGVRSVPTVAVTDTILAEWGPGPDEAVLRAAGIGEPVAEEVRKRVVEIFSAGCRTCEDTIALVRKMACRSCDVRVLDMRDREVAALSKSLGIRRVPSVAVTTTRFAACCAGRGPDASALKAAGIGKEFA